MKFACYLPFLLLLFVPTMCLDSIVSVTPSTQLVSSAATLTITLNLTSSTANIKFTLPMDYSVKSSGCTAQNLPASCSLVTSTSTQTLTFTGTFTSLLNFTFNVVNPYYESNF